MNGTKTQTPSSSPTLPEHRLSVRTPTLPGFGAPESWVSPAEEEPLDGAAGLRDGTSSEPECGKSSGWSCLRKKRQSCPGSEAGGWAGGLCPPRFALSLWHLELWTSQGGLAAALGFYLHEIKGTEGIIFPLRTH